MHLTEERNLGQGAPKLLVVGGGKGGVGKTCFSVNTAVEVARRGWRVVLLDADLSCSNIETVLGVQSESRLDDFFNQEGRKQLEGVICDTPYDNLRLVPGTSGLLNVANPRFQQKQVLIRELMRLDADLVIVDLDAGAHLNTLDFFLMTDHNGIVVVTPEKTSIDNAFKFLRSALYRRIERFYRAPEVSVLLQRNETLRDFLAALRQSSGLPEETVQTLCQEVEQVARSFRPRIVVNKASNAYEAKIAANILSKYAREYLGVEPDTLGHILFDQYVSVAVNSGIPFTVSKPKAKVSGCIVDIANRLGYY